MPDTAQHWHARAEEARTHAKKLSDPETQRRMLSIANDYERLARRAEERLNEFPEPLDR